MRLVSFQVHDYTSIGLILHETGFGVYQEDEASIIDLYEGFAVLLHEEGKTRAKELSDAVVSRRMETFLEGGEDSLAAANRVLERFRGMHPEDDQNRGIDGRPIVYHRKEVHLLAPVRRPPRIICLSHNYHDFIEETGVAVPPEPRIFSKYFNAICGPEDPIIYPPMTQELGYEAELAFVVGKRGRYIPEDKAYDYIAGYTIFNDISASDLTARDKISVVRGKTFDNFAPCGPWLVTKDEIEDCHALHIECRVNGKVLQESNTKHLIYDVPKLVSFLSEIFTLEPGDIVATGTPGGLAKHRNPKAFMQVGDVCEVEVEKLGVLRNAIVREHV